MQCLKILIFSDGGARGNPGPAAVGVKFEIRNSKSEIRNHKISKYIGTATNNQAEYQAVIEALKWIRSNRQNLIPGMRESGSEGLEIECFLDSQLIVEQLNQRYKLKNEGLKPLFWEIRGLVMSLGGKITFKYIPREQNKEADKLVNLALDGQKGKRI